VAQYQVVFEDAWARIRSVHKRGWKPSTSVEGLERIEAARAAGAGTILWRMSFGSSLNVKIGLWRAGIPIVHLSHETHGSWSGTRIASKILRSLYRRTEKWYLAERVIIPQTGGRGKVMKTLLRRLMEDNAVVSIVGDLTGTQNVTTPFLDGQAKFAIGSPSLAWKAKSALLPVYAVRQATGDYRIVIEEPIEVDRTLDRKEAVRRAVEEFSERMQDAIARHPGSWSNWGRFLGSGSRALEVSPEEPPGVVG
jgi:lauroyl/myristoyl acyltransferase